MIKHMRLRAKVSLSIIGAIGLALITSAVSTFVPYVPSVTVKLFFSYVLPLIFLLLYVLLLIYTARGVKAGRFKQPKGYEKPNTLLLAVVAVAVCWVTSFVFNTLPAFPTKLFANHQISIPVRVDHLDGFRADHGYWVWVNFYDGDKKGHVMWTWSDPLMDQLKHGDCIELHGREWPLGIYVDSISRSTAYKDRD